MAINTLPEQRVLLDILEYDPQSGSLFWRENLGPRARKGREAFTRTQGTGHKRGQIFGVLYYAHRVIWKYVHGNEPAQIDHIDGNPSNNALSNLRATDSAGNSRNRRLSKSSTGVVGVTLKGGKYRADITVSGKQIYLGVFGTLEQAAGARRSASVHYGFHENHGRQ